MQHADADDYLVSTRAADDAHAQQQRREVLGSRVVAAEQQHAHEHRWQQLRALEDDFDGVAHEAQRDVAEGKGS